MCNTHGESNWCLGTYCLIIIGFITVIIMLESRNVSMCDVSESPQYSETDFYSSEPYRVYLRTKISTDCTLEFEEEDVYITYLLSNDLRTPPGRSRDDLETTLRRIQRFSMLFWTNF